MMLDNFSRLTFKPMIVPQTQTNADTALASSVIDLNGYESCTVLINYGAITDANVTFATVLADGADTATLTAVDDAFLLGTEAGATPTFGDDSTTYKLGYIGPKRYIQLTITPSGNNSGAVSVSATAVLSRKRKGLDTTQATT